MDINREIIEEANSITKVCFDAAISYVDTHSPRFEDEQAWTDLVASYAGLMSATISLIIMPATGDKESWED